MRYEDASQSGSSINETPDARDDADALAAGSRGPATGNVITGSGTQTGAAGADLGAEDANIVSVTGAGGSDTSFAGGKLAVDGQFGRLSIDSEGNYSYLANRGAPENSRDEFSYKLADGQGRSDSATLIVEIGKSPAVVQANAQRVVPGPDGTVVLPAGVQLSDVNVVGRNLVIDLPGGGQMVIVDGAIFVPRLVFGEVEVPATSLAALLIGSEIRPAAGSELAGDNQSSGGNFAIPVSPLDPGIDLGDLIPPTELAYIPPEYREVAQFEDSDPEILIQTPDQPAGAENATAIVNENALAARGAEPAGSDSASTAETTTGTIVYTSFDEPNTITVGGVVITTVGQVIPGTYGNLAINSIADGAIGYSYTLADNTFGDSTLDIFTVVITDRDGDQDTATLRIDIIDDLPTARADVDIVTEDGALVADGNLISGVGGSDANATDGVADTQGADGAFVSLVDGTNPDVGQVVPDGDGEQIVGQYGTLTVFANGSYSYALNNANAAVQALTTGQTLIEAFAYTLTDNDGDNSPSTLTITINGTNDVPTVTVPQVGSPATIVSEAGLPARGDEPAGSAAAGSSEITSGTITFTNGDGASTVTINGTPVVAGALITGDYGTLRIDSVVGQTIGYTYTLTDNVDDDTDLSPFESFDVLVADSDGNPTDDAAATLRIDIIDDTPLAAISAAGVTLIHDETPGVQLGTDFAGILSVSAASAGDDPDVAGTGPIGYARSSIPLSSAGSITGADGGTTVIGLTLSVNGVDSGLDVTDGTSIFLFKEGQTIVGRVGADATTAATGLAAFAIAVGTANVLEMVQYLSIKHPMGAAAGPDDLVTIAGNVLLATATVTDNDGDVSTVSTSIGELVGFEDDGPVATGQTVTVRVEEDELRDGVTDGDSFTDIAIGSLGPLANFGSDGPGGFSFDLSGVTLASLTSRGAAVHYEVTPDGLALIAFTGDNAAQNQVFIIQITDAAVGAFEVRLLEQVDHLPNTPANDDDQTLTFDIGGAIQMTDADGDTDRLGASVNVVIEDDLPVATNDMETLEIQIDNLGVEDVVAEWTNTVLTSGTPNEYDRDGDTFTDEIRWGNGSNGQSGYGFVDNPALVDQQVRTNVTFSLGTFTHFNNPITGSTLQSTTLAVNFTAVINGSEVTVGPIEISFTHNETPNSSDPQASRDIIMITGNTPTIVINGVEYELEVRGLVDEQGNLVTTVRTFENQTNSYSLLVRFVETDAVELTGNVLENDVTGADDPIELVAVSGFGGSDDASADGTGNFQVLGQYGTLTINQDGGYTYRLTADASAELEGAEEHFIYSIEDFDGDRTSATLVIRLDPNQAPLPDEAPTPVVIDTNHDGSIAYLGLEAGVGYDFDGDGQAEATAWVGGGDSLLVRDADGDGTVSDASEFVFGGNGLTDLEALHEQYGAQLDARDADFVQFMLWDDANSNGVADPGELESLRDAGIVSISLVSDGIASSAAGGDVAIAGTGSFTYVNDNGDTASGLLADVAFRTVDREIVQAQRFGAAANSAAVVTAAVAAMGLAATQAAANGHNDALRGTDVAAQMNASQAHVLTESNPVDAGASSALVGQDARVSADIKPETGNAASHGPASDATLTGMSAESSHEMAGLLAPSEVSAQDIASPVAPMIVLASAEAFEATASVNGVAGGKNAATVQDVLKEALDGGAGGGGIDAILAALPDHGDGQNAALDALASQNNEGVSGWDMGAAGHLSANLMTNIVTDMIAFHHDAVQPAING